MLTADDLRALINPGNEDVPTFWRETVGIADPERMEIIKLICAIVVRIVPSSDNEYERLATMLATSVAAGFELGWRARGLNDVRERIGEP